MKRIPKSYDAGVTTSGKSLGFRVDLSATQVKDVFRRHPGVNHIETPSGYYLRRTVIPDLCEEGAPVQSRDRRVTGRTTGSTRACSMSGCTGLRVSVRWPDGKTTFPCSKGITPTKNGFKLA